MGVKWVLMRANRKCWRKVSWTGPRERKICNGVTKERQKKLQEWVSGKCGRGIYWKGP